MKISGWQWGIGVVAVVTLAGVGVIVWQGRSGGASPKPAAVADGARAIAEVDRAASANGSQGRPKKRTRKIADPRDDMSAADRALYDAVQEALDAEDFARTRTAALRAYRSANPDVRLQAVEALGWFGEKALVDLVPMMGDANEDVAQEAATELVDAAEGDEASRLRVEAIQTLVDLMDQPGSPKRAEVSRELYEEITGHGWISIDEAERYLQDPENYEPPEDPAE